MKMILAPARKMKEYVVDFACTIPVFNKQAAMLSRFLKEYSPWEFETLLETNEALALKAFIDVQGFGLNKIGTPALFAYDGTAYKSLDPISLSSQALEHSVSVLRIISAFYGLLKPFDLIQPYRLEMHSRLNMNGENLYLFWGSKIYQELYKNDDCVLNLSSEEYAKIVRKYLKIGDRFVDIIFYSFGKGRRQIVSTVAKKARGQMARYILENKIIDCEKCKDFEWDGFEYVSELSDVQKYVFMQKESTNL